MASSFSGLCHTFQSDQIKLSQIHQGMFQDHIIAETPDYKHWAVEHETGDSLKVTGLKIKLHVKEPSILSPWLFVAWHLYHENKYCHVVNCHFHWQEIFFLFQSIIQKI